MPKIKTLCAECGKQKEKDIKRGSISELYFCCKNCKLNYTIKDSGEDMSKVEQIESRFNILDL